MGFRSTFHSLIFFSLFCSFFQKIKLFGIRKRVREREGERKERIKKSELACFYGGGYWGKKERLKC